MSPRPSAPRSPRCASAGLSDVVPRPLKYDRPYTYWDYRQLALPQEPGHAHRPGLRQRAVRQAPSRTATSTARSARARAPPTTRPVVVDLERLRRRCRRPAVAGVRPLARRRAPARPSCVLSGRNGRLIGMNFLPRTGARRHARRTRRASPSAVGRTRRASRELLSECELLRARAGQHGLELDDSPASLEALDQLPPRWRDDPEELPWLGNDAGLYLGTVIVRTVPGAVWDVWPGGQPVVRSGLRAGDRRGRGRPRLGGDRRPELSQVYAEAAPRPDARSAAPARRRAHPVGSQNTVYALFVRVECEVPYRAG